jgi:hypothetical protein
VRGRTKEGRSEHGARGGLWVQLIGIQPTEEHFMDLSFLDAIGGVRVAALVAIGIAALLLLPRLFGGREEKKHFQRKSCTRCGWTGEVSSFKARCPRCAQVLE